MTSQATAGEPLRAPGVLPVRREDHAALLSVDAQELSKTHEAISRAKTEIQHRILTHYLPLYIPEVERFKGNSRSDWLFAFLERFPTPASIIALSKEAFLEHPTGLAAIRMMLLSGFRRMEALGLERKWVSRPDHCVRFPDTKSGAQIRVLGAAAILCLESAPEREGSPFLFPADWGNGHFIGIVRVLDRVCAKANLKEVTPHVLRHTFASAAGDLGFSELTIADLLGHSARGVTQGYVHLNTALVVAADCVSARIAELLDGDSKAVQRRRSMGTGGTGGLAA